MTETATLAGGCFWCLEAVFEQLAGVREVESGYAGGTVPHPTYEQVCEGRTGHAEAVQVTFEPAVITFRDLLEVFFTLHDPTTPNRQGPDAGTQYRSAVFVHTPEQERTAREVITRFERERVWDGRIVTEVVPFTGFWPAEAYHRRFYDRNPDQLYCKVQITPKLAKLRSAFRDRLKSATA
jgi:peptide-methionine (S)-S-oxide reductase